LENSNDRLERIILVLRTIRTVNQLIIKEKDRVNLIARVCEALVQNQSYFNAWIALLNESGELITAAESGLGKDFLPMIERWKQGELPSCAQKALEHSEVVAIEDPLSVCTDCPLSGNYTGRGGLSIRLEYEGKVYGVLAASVPRGFEADKEEKNLIEEVAADIAFALYSIQLDEEHRRSEKLIQKTTQTLNKRNKELNCLYAISTIVDQRNISLEKILQQIVGLIPSAWIFPEAISVRVLLGKKSFATSNFQETTRKQACNIVISGKSAGVLEVFRINQKSKSDEGPFSREDQKLIASISERLGKIIERKKARRAVQESEKRFRLMVENSLTGISIIQNNKIVYQNPEQERLLGPLPRKFLLTDIENNIHSDDIAKVKDFNERMNTSGDQTMDVEFRFYPPQKKDARIHIKWVYCRSTPIRYQGKDSILVNLADLTKTKEFEHLLRIQDKMTSLGRVTAGIAHEIRNPLSGINIYLNTLEKMYDKPEMLEKTKRILVQIKSASRKIESIIRRVMDFSKPSEPKLILTNLNQPIKAAINLSAVTLRKSGIEIEQSFTENLQTALLDPSLIEEVVLNLIHNAAEAMKNQDRPKIIKITSLLKSENLVAIVSDSGPGVPLGLKGHIFDPFYTTKNGNTGIGLSLCHRIINDHGGTLDVTTSQWGGAEFRIALPIRKETTPK